MQSSDASSYRANQANISRDPSQFSWISKSLAFSSSQQHKGERYFHRRQSNNSKFKPIELKKLKNQKICSIHQLTASNKSSKLSPIFGNQQLKETSTVAELSSYKQCKYESHKTLKQTEEQAEKKNKVFRRTSNWSMINYSKEQQIKKVYKLQLTDNRGKSGRNSHYIKEKVGKRSNIDLVLQKHKADNLKQIQQKIRSAMNKCVSQDSQKLMTIKDFNRKCGYPEDTKLFIWNSEDQHIRRQLLKLGWIQNPSIQSPFFHFKWTHMPHFAESKLWQKQYINHFKNSQQISSKSYLTKNLKTNQSSYGKIEMYYPKCYDIGNPIQMVCFAEQFKHNAMLILLKKAYRFCLKMRERETKAYDRINCSRLVQEENRDLKRSIFRNRKFRQIEMEDFKNRDSKFLLQINLILQMLRYWRNFRKNRQCQEDNSYHFLLFDQRKFEQIFDALEKYALTEDIGNPSSDQDPYLSKQQFSTPSNLLIERISKEYQYCKEKNLSFESFGENNIWIVKPASNSRGNGIYLSSNIYEIQQCSKNIQSRLVQKYIQKPLIIENAEYRQIVGRKFDLRQWVLLKNIEPLQVYIFSECYLRLCSEKYKERQIKQLYRHLTNYSINKDKFKNRKQSVLPSSYLKQILLDEYNLDWQYTIKEKMVDIIKKSIRSCIQNLDDQGGCSFQLYGYDFLIDQNFEVWLLEVNMSPACQERTEWLTQYLSKMSSGLLKLVLPELLPQDLQNSEVEGHDYRWQLILRQQSCYNRKKDVEVGLQIIGNSVKLSDEKEIDRKLIEDIMALRIQRFMKKYVRIYKGWKIMRQQKLESIRQYFETAIRSKELKQKQECVYTEEIQKYVQGFIIAGRAEIMLKSRKNKSIEDYLVGVIGNWKYKILRDSYRKEILSHFNKVLSIRKQLSQFCEHILSINKKSRSIQEKIREFLYRRKEKKQLFEKYFATLLQVKEFCLCKQEKIREDNIATIEKSICTFSLCILFQNRQKNAHLQAINQYLRVLPVCQQFYHKKLCIFQSLVGRVVRVTRRRVRCQYFKVILQGWKRQIQKKVISEAEAESKRIRMLIVMNKDNKAQLLQLGEKLYKAGTIRSNRKDK